MKLPNPIPKAAEPDTEAVEGELTAGPSQALRKDLYDLNVLHHRRVGDLEDKPSMR